MNYPMFYCSYQTSNTITILPCKLRNYILPIYAGTVKGDNILYIIITDPNIFKEDINIIILKAKVRNKRRKLEFFKFSEYSDSTNIEFNFEEVISLEDLHPCAIMIDYKTRKINYIGDCRKYKETIKNFCTCKLYINLTDCFLHPVTYSEP